MRILLLLYIFAIAGCSTIHDGTNTNSGNIVIWGCDKLDKETK